MSNELTFKEYNKKSFAVYGDKSKYATLVKSIGGRWNSRMKGGTPGWLVPRENLNKLKKLVSSVNSLKADFSKTSSPKPEIKSRKNQTKYHREVSEDSETEDEIVSEPEDVNPEVSEPEVSEPEVSEPEVSEPEVSEPEVSEPRVSEPETVKSEEKVEDVNISNERKMYEKYMEKELKNSRHIKRNEERKRRRDSSKRRKDNEEKRRRDSSKRRKDNEEKRRRDSSKRRKDDEEKRRRERVREEEEKRRRERVRDDKRIHKVKADVKNPKKDYGRYRDVVRQYKVFSKKPSNFRELYESNDSDSYSSSSDDFSESSEDFPEPRNPKKKVYSRDEDYGTLFGKINDLQKRLYYVEIKQKKNKSN